MMQDSDFVVTLDDEELDRRDRLLPLFRLAWSSLLTSAEPDDFFFLFSSFQMPGPETLPNIA